MNRYKILSTCLFLLVFSALKAQDLLRKVPQDANIVFTFNNSAFFDHLKLDDLNLALTRWGFFEKVYGKTAVHATKLQDMGVDLNNKAYAYIRATDSIQYVGAFIPLSDPAKFEAMIPDHKKIETVDGLSTVYSSDRTTRLSWDQQTLYLLTGNPSYGYFNTEDVKKRYGLLTQTYDYAYPLDTTAAATFISPSIVDPDTVDFTFHEFDTLEVPDPPVLDPVDGAALLDSVAAIEQRDYSYSDPYDSIYRYNDSVKNALTREWVNKEMVLVLTGGLGSYDGKNIPKLTNKDLVHVHVRQLEAIYSRLYPEAILQDFFGIRPKFDYGIAGIDAKLVVDGRAIKIVGDATLDKEMASYYRAIYKKKMNPRFYPYLDENVLGFMTLQMSTEAYLAYFPKILDRYYGGLLPNHSKAMSFGITLFDVLLDEKAIGRVFKGDNLFVLNGVTTSDVPYTDYVYDDEYNYKEVQKTRTETIPQFLWIFSSDDTRVFEKLIQMGLQENELTDQGGIYALKKKNSGMQLLFLIKNGLVFIGNDMTKMQAIQSGKTSSKGHAPYVAMAKKNVFSLLFNTRRLPALLDDLRIPVERSLKGTIQQMSQYGDFYMTSGGIKGRKLQGEIVVEFPDKNGNALAFLFDTIDQWLLRSIER